MLFLIANQNIGYDLMIQRLMGRCRPTVGVSRAHPPLLVGHA